jgi:hypothetical protein
VGIEVFKNGSCLYDHSVIISHQPFQCAESEIFVAWSLLDLWMPFFFVFVSDQFFPPFCCFPAAAAESAAVAAGPPPPLLAALFLCSMDKWLMAHWEMTPRFTWRAMFNTSTMGRPKSDNGEVTFIQCQFNYVHADADYNSLGWLSGRTRRKVIGPPYGC